MNHRTCDGCGEPIYARLDDDGQTTWDHVHPPTGYGRCKWARPEPEDDGERLTMTRKPPVSVVIQDGRDFYQTSANGHTFKRLFTAGEENPEMDLAAAARARDEFKTWAAATGLQYRFESAKERA